MPQKFLEYTLEDGTTVLIQAPEGFEPSGPIKISGEQEDVTLAEKKFSQALEGVRKQAKELRKKLEDIRADEVEVKFSLTTTGEVGNFAVGKIGVEANYEVTLKWDNQAQPKVHPRRIRKALYNAS